MMTNAAKAGASPNVVSLKVTLRGTKPPIWRRVLVSGSTKLDALHEAVQAAMGWQGGHLHAFDVDGEQYGDPRQLDDVADERRLTLDKMLKLGVTRFGYTYDFGDSWEHALVIEKVLPATDDAPLPVCTAGKRRCPPEDCGGVWGYAELLEALADPAHPEYAERAELLEGDDFDPEAFSLDAANAALAARFRTRAARGGVRAEP